MYVFSVDGSMMLGTLGCGAEDAEGIKGMMKIPKSLEVLVTETSYVKTRRSYRTEESSRAFPGRQPVKMVLRNPASGGTREMPWKGLRKPPFEMRANLKIFYSQELRK